MHERQKPVCKRPPAKLKAEAAATAREEAARRRAEEETRLQAEAEAKSREAELPRLALQTEARAHAVAAEAKSKAEAEARAGEIEARRRAADDAQLQAEMKAQAEAEYQARLKLENDIRIEAESELTAQEPAHRAAAEARIEQTVAAKNSGELTAFQPDFDPFGLPNLSLPTQEFDAPSTLHPADPHSPRIEPVLDSPVEPPDTAEQEPYPKLDEKHNKIPARDRKRNGERQHDFAPARRAPEALRGPSKLAWTTKVRRRGTEFDGVVLSVSPWCC